MNVLADLKPKLALGDEQHRFGLGVHFRLAGAAARADLHHVMRKALGKPGHGPRNHPDLRVAPIGQRDQHDIGHRAPRNHGIGVGEDGLPGARGHQVRLRGETPRRRCVGARGHWFPR